jgi:excisionase family DNA binding protein
MMLDPKRVAARLGVSVTTVHTLVKRGELRAHRFGTMLRISEADLEEFLCRTVIKSSASTAGSTSSPQAMWDNDAALLWEQATRRRLKELRQSPLKHYPEDGT